MTRIQIKLSPEEAGGLVELAQANLRDPREQLRFLLREALQRQGFLITTPSGASKEDEPLDGDTTSSEDE
jgi:hypothetical protein